MDQKGHKFLPIYETRFICIKSQEYPPNLQLKFTLGEHSQGKEGLKEACLLGLFINNKFEIGLAVIEERAKHIVELVLCQHLPGVVDFLVILIAFKDAQKLF